MVSKTNRYIMYSLFGLALIVIAVLGTISILHIENIPEAKGSHAALDIILMLAFVFVLMAAVLILFAVTAIKRDNKINKTYNELKSVAGIYESMHKISIDANVIHEYYATDQMHQLFLRPFPKLKEIIYYVIKQISSDQDLDMMKSFVDFDTLAHRLNGQKLIEQEFSSKKNGWCKAIFIRVDGKEATEEVIFAIEAINEEKEKENRLMYLSETDLMTTLRNRGSGERAIRQLLQEKQKGAFLLMDVDKFKRYNDTYGHSAGDDVIIAVAKTLKGVFRSEDIVMRLGGDEFAVFMMGAQTEDAIKQKIYVLFQAIDNIHLKSIMDSRIHISLGAAIYDGKSYQNFESLYHAADECTYKSKSIEGNAYTINSANEKA